MHIRPGPTSAPVVAHVFCITCIYRQVDKVDICCVWMETLLFQNPRSIYFIWKRNRVAVKLQKHNLISNCVCKLSACDLVRVKRGCFESTFTLSPHFCPSTISLHEEHCSVLFRMGHVLPKRQVSTINMMWETAEPRATYGIRLHILFVLFNCSSTPRWSSLHVHIVGSEIASIPYLNMTLSQMFRRQFRQI